MGDRSANGWMTARSFLITAALVASLAACGPAAASTAGCANQCTIYLAGGSASVANGVTNVTSPFVVTPLTLSTGQLQSPIPFPIVVPTPESCTAPLCFGGVEIGSGPFAMVMTPDGGMAYIVNRFGQTVTAVNVHTGQASAPMKLSGGSTVDVGIDAAGKEVDVLMNAGSQYDATVTPIDVATGHAGMPVDLGPASLIGADARAIRVAPDGDFAYVIVGIKAGMGSLVPVNLTTHTALPPIQLPGDPWALALSPDGRSAYVQVFVGNSGDTELVSVSLTGGQILRTAPLATGIHITDIEPTRDGTLAYLVGPTLAQPCGPGMPIPTTIPPTEPAYCKAPSTSVTPVSLPALTLQPPIVLGQAIDAAVLVGGGSEMYVLTLPICVSPCASSSTQSATYLQSVIPVNLMTRQVGTPIRLKAMADAMAVG